LISRSYAIATPFLGFSLAVASLALQSAAAHRQNRRRGLPRPHGCAPRNGGGDSRGLAVDIEGAALGPDFVLVRRTPGGCRCADRDEIATTLRAVYGTDRDAAAIFAGACRIAEALAEGEVALAQIVGLHLPLPEPLNAR
jgi:hypothetical protein